MKVLKFGGTSVGAADRMRQVGKIVTDQPGKKIVVLSALSGTTNTLVRIGEHLLAGNKHAAADEIEKLYTHYLEFISNLIGFEKPEHAKAEYIINDHFKFIRSLMQVSFSENITKELLAQGELMSTKLFALYLDTAGFKNELLPALEFMAIDDKDEPDMAYIQMNLTEMLQKRQETDLYITQGYICLNASQKIDNLKRGGSDYTASLIGAAIRAERIEIWTDIDGMHNNDPREVEHTRPVAKLSFEEASELAYFGAKILHPSSILPAKQYNIPVQLKNTLKPDAFGTMISSNESSKEVKAIAAKDGIAAIKIKSTRMLLAYGFLNKVFEVFEKHKTPIDMITTSEVAVSLTVDDDRKLPEIVNEPEDFGSVTIDYQQSIICMVGNDVVSEKGIMIKIFESLLDIPIRMISYGGSKYNVSVLIETKYKKQALQALNKGLFQL